MFWCSLVLKVWVRALLLAPTILAQPSSSPASWNLFSSWLLQNKRPSQNKRPFPYLVLEPTFSYTSVHAWERGEAAQKVFPASSLTGKM